MAAVKVAAQDKEASLLGVRGLMIAVAGELRPYRWQLLLAGLAIVPYSVFISAEPVILRELIDQAIIPRNVSLVFEFTGILAALLALQAIGDLVHGYLIGWLAAHVTNQIRLKLFTHLQQLSLTFFQRSRIGDLSARFTTDLETVDQSLNVDLPYGFSCLLTIVIGLAVLVSVDWRITLVCLAATPLIFLGPRWLGPRAESCSYQRQEDQARVGATVQEQLGAQLVVKSFGLQRVAQDRFKADIGQLAQTSVRGSLLAGLLTTAVTASGSLLLVLSIGLGAFLAVGGQISPGQLVAFVEVFWWMVNSIQQVSGLLPSLQRSAGGMQRIQELLAEPVQIADAEDAQALPPLRERIELRQVGFSYTGQEQQLVDVSLTLPAGKTVAFVGQSGSGKSTLLSLLIRFNDPTSGSVSFDGMDLRGCTDLSLRQQIAVVFQESLLFDAAIRENIRVGRIDASDQEVEEAARDADLHDFICSLPEGYDTLVGERGGRLSGGQRQRIAIARAIIRDPAVMVLDEATSALDAETEAAITATLRRLSRDRTVISVTHRLASVLDADLIVVLDRGRVVEQGTHQQLLGFEGAYARMWRRQSGFVLSADGRHAAIGIERLAEIPLFQGIDPGLLTPVARLFSTERCKAGDILYDAGEIGGKFYILVRGTVELLRSNTAGEDAVLEVLQDGDFLGDIELLHEQPLGMTAHARTECLLLALDRGHLLALLDAVPVLRAVFEQVAEVRQQREGMHEAAQAGLAGWSDTE